MIEAVNSSYYASLSALESSRSVSQEAALAISEGHITPEVVSAGEIAQQIQEVQVSNLKRALEAQTYVLDLLV